MPDQHHDERGCCVQTSPGETTEAIPPPPDGERASGCVGGRIAGPDTRDRCCWPGQVWDQRCRGIPDRCPSGMHADAPSEECVPDLCVEGRERVRDSVACCYPGQVVFAGACRGVPASCPADRRVEGETCVAIPRVPVRFDVTPGGATVRLDDAVAVRPGAVLALLPGEHTVRAEADGYRPVGRTFRVEPSAGATQTIALERRAGTLIVETSATGATVALDGAPGVAAPARLPNVPMGRHRVVVQAVERVAFAVDVDVRDGETARVEVPPLEPVRHRLQITARGVRSPYEISVSQGAAARRCVAAADRPCVVDDLVAGPVSLRVEGYSRLAREVPAETNPSLVIAHEGYIGAIVFGTLAGITLAGGVALSILAATSPCADYQSPVEPGGFRETTCVAPVAGAIAAGTVGLVLGVLGLVDFARVHDTYTDASVAMAPRRPRLAIGPAGITWRW
jgi:hypothetical protein